MADRLFRDRRDAGRVLANLLKRYHDRGDVVVLALPRGGVPVAYEVATALGAPLDILLVRKLGVPGHKELAMGAIASGGMVFINDDLVRRWRIPPEVVQRVAEQEGRELLRRELAYRDGRPSPVLAGKVVENLYWFAGRFAFAPASAGTSERSGVRRLEPGPRIWFS
jgi:predicted phosphoribosyltransferase